MNRLDLRALLQAYASGIFPMADSRDAPDLFWVEPRQRAILPLERFHLSRSLRRVIVSGRFTLTHDQDFPAIVAACADRPETWINAELEQAMIDLHRLGCAHSIEAWEEGRLAGGLYGVRLGRAFFGESMFSRSRDASKVALAWLVARLKVGRFSLLDCQFVTDHLRSLGAETVPREAYVALLAAAVGAEGAGGCGGDGDGALGEVASAGSDDFAAAAAVPDFFALDALLEAEGAAGAAGPAGNVIAQLLTQTS